MSIFLENEVEFNSAIIRNNTYKEKLFSADILNLSCRHPSKDDNFLLSKRLRFVPTPKHVNKNKIKEEVKV